jgi:hypothetical protein
MTDNYTAFARRLARKLDVMRLDARAMRNEQLAGDLHECLILLAKMEKEHDRNIFDITDRGI